MSIWSILTMHAPIKRAGSACPTLEGFAHSLRNVCADPWACKLDLKNCYWLGHPTSSTVLGWRPVLTGMQLSEFRLAGIKCQVWCSISLIVFCLPFRPLRFLSSSIWMTFFLRGLALMYGI